MRHGLTVGASVLAVLTWSASAAAQRTEIRIPDERAFLESVTATSDGTAYISSAGLGVIYRVAPGASDAQRWAIGGPAPAQVFGVLAQERAGLLWACIHDRAPAPGQPAPSQIRTYDLKTGALRQSYGFAGKSCNDIAIATDGTVYATDVSGAQVTRLRKGEQTFTPWSSNPSLAVVDGIEILSNGIMINTYRTGTLQRIPLNRDGSAGAPVPIVTDRPLDKPDGMRRIGRDRFVLAEAGGRIDEVTVVGDKATIRPLRENVPDGPNGITRIKGADLVTLGKFNLMATPQVDPGKFVVMVVPHARR